VSDDIATFIGARLDEDERFALAACGRPGDDEHPAVIEHWQWECCHDDMPVDPELDIANGEIYALSHDEVVYRGCGGYRIGLRSAEQYETRSVGLLSNLVLDTEEVSPQAARHIARYDPARVLREVEAKRMILARYEDCVARQEDSDYPQGAARDQAREYEDFVLPHLAAAWRDHPDWRQEWAA
jgi:Family of unknown function (DUF6221)